MISSYTEALQFISSNKTSKPVSVNIETTGLLFIKNRVLGISISIAENKSVYITVRNWEELKIKCLIMYINKCFTYKTMYNCSFDTKFTGGSCDLKLTCEFDVYLAIHTLYNHRSYGKQSLKLHDMSEFILREPNWRIDETNLINTPDKLIAASSKKNTEMTLKLYHYVIEQFEKRKFYWADIYRVYQLKKDVTGIYINASLHGCKIDTDIIPVLVKKYKKIKKKLNRQMKKSSAILETEKIWRKSKIKDYNEQHKANAGFKQIRKIVNKFYWNPNSPIQKQILFYVVLKQPIEDYTDKGNPSVDKDVLGKFIARNLDEAQLIYDYMIADKGLSFLRPTKKDSKNALSKLVSEGYPYIHPNMFIGTLSGRTVTTDPNLSQFPSSQLIEEIKKCFIPRVGKKLWGFDYSNIELRLLAEESGEQKLIEAFNNNLDLHKQTAEQLGVDRRSAKAVNFGIIYGITKTGLSNNLGISKPEAQSIINKYFQTYPLVRKYINDNISFANKNEFTTDTHGNRLYLPNVMYSFKQKNLATNFKLQSGCAGYMYKGLIDFYRNNNNSNIKLLFSVYDSCLFEVPKEMKQEEFVARINNSFKFILNNVALTLDYKLGDGKNWYELENKT